MAWSKNYSLQLTTAIWKKKTFISNLMQLCLKKLNCKKRHMCKYVLYMCVTIKSLCVHGSCETSDVAGQVSGLGREVCVASPSASTVTVWCDVRSQSVLTPRSYWKYKVLVHLSHAQRTCQASRNVSVFKQLVNQANSPTKLTDLMIHTKRLWLLDAFLCVNYKLNFELWVRWKKKQTEDALDSSIFSPVDPVNLVVRHHETFIWKNSIDFN